MLGGMAIYDVVQHGQWPGPRGRALEISAASPGEAVMRARRAFDLTRLSERDTPDQLYAVYRHRRVRGRRLVGVFGDAGPGGLAGVREPRRPLPDPPSLRTRRDLPS
ncbi:hypothetical protein FBY26_0565 [Phycicoccus sp. SLBN-51]|jgi:hypothetical protein|nr:hypothetical protein FBY26_0565 [Phycicoccus sp. SLBN-51]